MALQSRFIWVALSLLVLCSVCAQAAENMPPQVILTKSSGTAIIGEQIILDATGSRDPEGGPLVFVWFFADDNVEKSGPLVTHAYSTPGTKTIGLTVTDNQGAQTVSSAKITVNPLPSEEPTPPLATETTPQTNETFEMPTQMTPIANPIITMIPTTGFGNEASGQSPGSSGSGSGQGAGSASGNASPAGPPYFMYMVVVAGVLVGVVLVGIYFVKRPR